MGQPTSLSSLLFLFLPPLRSEGKKRHRRSACWFPIVVAALAVWPGTTSAQVFKCIGHDGRVTYADQPCRGAARVTEVPIEPNVIETAADRLKEQADAAADQVRRSKPTAECERAVDELERVRRAAPPDSAAARSAYERVLQFCRDTAAAGRSSTPVRDLGAAPGTAPRGSGSERPVEVPLPPGATERGGR